ncbi:uncharacterized protein SPPG_04886 [Spizellomyces punctatus DAOM BR117]|uniref:Uncharacterized protein n=1 Tax=Spizellomyces punctatus (strain DAOM BR117) TaxID=645134 RepID=A0A0L0HDC5_SPIPD|nr:uncharacterized protein SPPG_04886 [Spizellomyces punctatus DAOM BR117]KNC99490.1 hypothetical protein SPPG_04886 [Spizellomyces punctatus DAOM BR117]|eukprot:XP_016607530.1 hypothetical protein SPPG_04886 [Spizellomyces punctatus DAOM BR117]
MLKWFSLLVLAAVVVPRATASVFLTTNVHAGPSCNSKIVAFTQLNVTWMLETSGLLNVLSNATEMKMLSDFLHITVPTSISTCNDVVNFLTLLDKIEQFQDQDNSTSPLALGFNITATEQVNVTFSSESSSRKNFGPTAFGNTTRLLNDECIPVNMTGTIMGTSARCNAGSTSPALPPSADNFVVTYKNLYDTTCNYDHASIIYGQVADGTCYGALPIVGFQSIDDASCTKAVCTNNSPNVTAFSSSGAMLASLSANDTQCQIQSAPNSTSTSEKVICKAGLRSLVTVATKDVRTWPANSNQAVTFPGNLGLKLSANSDVPLNVTVAPTPSVAGAPPTNGINTFYHFEVPSGTQFKADLTFTYDANLLSQYQYKAEDLKWAVYDESSGVWNVKTGSTVNTGSMTVLYTTSSFSEWTIVAAATSAALTMTPSMLMIVGLSVLSAFVTMKGC